MLWEEIFCFVLAIRVSSVDNDGVSTGQSRTLIGAKIMGSPNWMLCRDIPALPEALPDPPRYDYANQAWIVGGKYENCSHPDDMDCKCFGRLHAGETAL